MSEYQYGSTSDCFTRGTLVRTVRRYGGGLNRVEVHGTKTVDNKLMAFGQNWEFPVSELEIIRPAIIR